MATIARNSESESSETKLLNILAQRKAQWFLDHIDYFFLLDEGEFSN